MKNFLRPFLAVLVGLIVGNIINITIISISGILIPLPEGVDATNTDSLIENIHLFEAKHFIMPFLAHALGTLSGAIVAAFIYRPTKLISGLILGGIFLIGGIMMATMIPAPMWFNILDLGLAYIPMGWLGSRLIKSKI